MGRANWIIVTLGLAACLALSMFMRHTLTVQNQAQVDPVIQEMVELFGGRLRGIPEFAVEQRGDKPVGVLVITPRLAAAGRHLAFLLGNFVWGECGDTGRFRALEVVVRGHRDGLDLRFRIPRPFIGQRTGRRIGTPEMPASTGPKALRLPSRPVGK